MMAPKGKNGRLARDTIALAKQLGFEVDSTNGGHFVARHPRGGPPIYFGATSQSHAGAENARALMRRTVRNL